jgi:hypothetical protein
MYIFHLCFQVIGVMEKDRLRYTDVAVDYNIKMDLEYGMNYTEQDQDNAFMHTIMMLPKQREFLIS